MTDKEEEHYPKDYYVLTVPEEPGIERYSSGKSKFQFKGLDLPVNRLNIVIAQDGCFLDLRISLSRVKIVSESSESEEENVTHSR